MKHCVHTSILDIEINTCFAIGCNPAGFDNYCAKTSSVCKVVTDGEFCEDCIQKAERKAIQACIPTENSGANDSPANGPAGNDQSTENTPTNAPSSNNPPTNDPTSNNQPQNSYPACFPADSVVLVENGISKRADEIQLGDKIMVGPKQYSQVFGFTHRQKNGYFRFLEFHLSSGSDFRVTPGHYLYVNNELKTARSVRVGDVLKHRKGGFVTVISIDHKLHEGIINPQTVHGDIVVDNIVASTYTDAINPHAAHSLLLPMRSVFRVFGVSSVYIE